MKELELTNIQRAYLLGRESNFELGGCSTHVYYEFLTALDPQHFEKALNKVINMQPVMRSVINKQGTQTIFDNVEYYKVNVLDWSQKSDEEIGVLLNEKRKELSHRVLPCGTWPMFSFEFAKMPKGDMRLFADYDLIVSDAISFVILCGEIKKVYENDDIIPLEGNYEEYLQHLKDVKASKKYARDKEYWNKNLSRTAPAPKLPYVLNEEGEEFARRHFYVEEKIWSKVKEKLKKINVTPTVAALAAYACVLGFWSGDEYFTLNLPMTSSMRKQKGMDRIVGDFTESILVTLPKKNVSMSEYLNIVAKEFFNAFKHKNYDGIEIMGDLRRKNGEAVMLPVVFTGMIAENMGFEQIDFLGKMVYGISQTPQVKLDCQVFETCGMLKVVWDYKKKYFKQAEIDAMFDEYIRIISKLADDDVYPQVPEYQQKILEEYNNSACELAETNLISLYEKSFEKFSEKTAVKGEGKSYTYETLGKTVNAVAKSLADDGVKKGDRVGILGERKAQTVAAILGIVKMGGVYVPVNPQYPKERQKYILENSHCVKMIDSKYVDDLKIENSHEIKCEINPDDEAYVIYTSGSTGKPKGVVITHEGASNTLQDINGRFSVNEKDVFLNVASFGFDLSVYDVFASIAAGGTLNVAQDPKNIENILETLKKENVTIWNSVPAMMGLLTDVMEDDEIVESLRLVLLSGDWIPVDLPGKIKKHFPNAQVISLGGATEASVWSIIYPVEKEMKGFKSVPYGYPMANQNMYILDENMRSVPLETVGEIYIGGRGVAKGYDGDDEKTSLAFINHEKLGRIYKTGDFGAIKREGYMEFCGRRDSQIKINGHRIELGEIESALLNVNGVEKAVAGKHENDIIAYIVTEKCKHATFDEKRLSEINGVARREKEIWKKDIDFEKMHEYMSRLDKTAILYMYDFFENISDFDSAEEFFEYKHILKKYEGVLFGWLKELEKEKCVSYENGKINLKKSADFENLQSLKDEISNENMGDISAYFFKCCENLESILTGKINPLELFYGEGDSKIAKSIYDGNDMSQAMNALLGKITGEIAKNSKTKILELGAGIGSGARRIFENIEDCDCTYVYSDISDFFLEKAKKEFGEENKEFKTIDINENIQSQGCKYGEFDIVIISNTMHDAKDIFKTLEFIREILKENGILIILETTVNTRAQMVSFGLLEGLSSCEDFRKNSDGPMMDSEKWIETLKKVGFENIFTAIEKGEFGGMAWQNIFVGRKSDCEKDIAEETLFEALKSSVPEYMLPSKIYRIKEMPLSVNGKVDVKALPVPKIKAAKKAYVQPSTREEIILQKLWKENLNVGEIGIDDSFFELGGDSLKAIKLVTCAKKEGVNFDLAQLYKCATIRRLAKEVSFGDCAFEEADSCEESVSEEDFAAILEAID